MLNDHHSGPAVNETLEHAQQGAHIQRVQADGRLVEYKHGVGLPFAHLAGELEPLGLPARKAGGGLAQSQVAQPQAGKGLHRLATSLRSAQAARASSTLISIRRGRLSAWVPSFRVR